MVEPIQAADRPAQPPPVVPPASSPELKTLASLAVAAVVIAALFIAQDVLIPIVLAVMVSFVLSPVVTVLSRLGLGRVPSVLVTVVLAFGLIALAATMLARQAAALAADAPRYAATIQQKIEGAEILATTRLGSLTRLIPSGRPASGQQATGAPPAVAAGRPSDATALSAAATAANGEPVTVRIAPGDSSPLLAMRTVVEQVLGPLETTVIVLVIAIFILMGREDLRDRFIRVAGSSDLHRTTAAMDDAARRLSRYFLSQVAVNGTFGIVIGAGLWALGIPSAALWGVLAGLLRFVPYIGAILAAVPPLALAAAIEPGWWRVGEVAVLFAVVEPATGYIVEPLLYGHSTGLAPVSVIVAAVFWTWIWGPIGLILSTPLTLCLVVMGRHVKSLEFFDVLLGDRPALAPIENLYQRILADNPDEALEKAESLLADRTLLEYYDGVVLPALKLAAQDEARGAIPHEHSVRMTRSLQEVIEDLSDHVDPPARGPVAPPQTPRETSRPRRAAPPLVVACIAGHGPFDDAVSAMLAQLLTRAGLRCREVPNADVARDRLPQLTFENTSVLILSYLDMTGSLSHLRYLVRRLRQRAPAARIIVGLWPTGDRTAPEFEERRESIGADKYVGSLGEGVAAVLEAQPRDAAVRPSGAPDVRIPDAAAASRRRNAG